jgi:hypothetical protein
MLIAQSPTTAGGFCNSLATGDLCTCDTLYIKVMEKPTMDCMHRSSKFFLTRGQDPSLPLPVSVSAGVAY